MNLLADGSVERIEVALGGAASLSGWRRLAKRALDLLGGLSLLVLLLPLLVVISVLVKSTSPGPVLFRQTRVGRGGRCFSVLKFRTMCSDASDLLEADDRLRALHRESGFKLPADEDPRVTPVGRFLRRLSLDELPQLVNVLKGDMSLVGPRPVVPDELDCYGDLVEYYLAAVPGMTGLWQVNGRSEVPFPERAEIDAQYVRDWSFWSDLVLLLRTVPALLRRHGAH